MKLLPSTTISSTYFFTRINKSVRRVDSFISFIVVDKKDYCSVRKLGGEHLSSGVDGKVTYPVREHRR